MIRETERRPAKNPVAVFHSVLLHLSGFPTSAAASLVTGHSPNEEPSVTWSPGEFPEI